MVTTLSLLSGWNWVKCQKWLTSGAVTQHHWLGLCHVAGQASWFPVPVQWLTYWTAPSAGWQLKGLISSRWRHDTTFCKELIGGFNWTKPSPMTCAGPDLTDMQLIVFVFCIITLGTSLMYVSKRKQESLGVFLLQLMQSRPCIITPSSS